MKRLVLILLSAIILIPCGLQAQKKATGTAKGHNIVFNIKGAKDEKVFLAVYFREKLILKDSAAVTLTKNGPQFIFKGEEPYQGGLYKLVSQKHFPYLDFVIDGSQSFTVNCDSLWPFDVIGQISFINKNVHFNSFFKLYTTS